MKFDGYVLFRRGMISRDVLSLHRFLRRLPWVGALAYLLRHCRSRSRYLSRLVSFQIVSTSGMISRVRRVTMTRVAIGRLLSLKAPTCRSYWTLPLRRRRKSFWLALRGRTLGKRTSRGIGRLACLVVRLPGIDSRVGQWIILWEKKLKT